MNNIEEKIQKLEEENNSMKDNIKKSNKKNKTLGITLIALIITIVILLILATITISSFSNSNLFNNSKLAKEKWDNATKDEENILSQYENQINLANNRDTLAIKSTILYPNGGTAESPANVTINHRYEMYNPFPGHNLYLITQIYYKGVWGETGFIYNGGGYGTKATQIQSENVDKIIIQTGDLKLLSNAPSGGNGFGNIDNNTETAPCRIKVFCLD